MATLSARSRAPQAGVMKVGRLQGAHSPHKERRPYNPGARLMLRALTAGVGAPAASAPARSPEE